MFAKALKTSVAAFLACQLLAMPVPTATAQAQETKLDGLVYPDSTECPGGSTCRLFFELRGEDAKLVYESMRSKPQADECVDGFFKHDEASGLHCYKGGGDTGYGCFFGYDLRRQKMTDGKFSC